MKKFDDTFRNRKINLIAGVDEAGRGPLAGPVVAAAVIFKPEFYLEEVDDSKKLSERTREKLFEVIFENALAVEYDIVSPNMIDKINILQASLLAMKNSVNKLNVKADLILIDGNKTFQHEIDRKAIVKGDAKSFSIAAASIIAKVIRDRIMVELDKEYPLYNWKQNKGYPTKEHIMHLRKHGFTKYHRKTFLKKILEEHQLDIFK